MVSHTVHIYIYIYIHLVAIIGWKRCLTWCWRGWGFHRGMEDLLPNTTLAWSVCLRSGDVMSYGSYGVHVGHERSWKGMQKFGKRKFVRENVMHQKTIKMEIHHGSEPTKHGIRIGLVAVRHEGTQMEFDGLLPGPFLFFLFLTRIGKWKSAGGYRDTTGIWWDALPIKIAEPF